MRIELRADSVLIEGYVNAVARDSRPMRDKKTGQRFVEQVVPGVFKRALERNEVDLLLDHDENRKLGSTQTNLSLHEDAIGLKARDKKLRGWSFGFYEQDASEEELSSGMKRRYIEDMRLVEVSLIDEKKMPCYAGTSVETRAEGTELLTPEPLEVRAEYAQVETPKETVDYSKYRERIKSLKKESEK